jgi:hypothetical protein
VRQLATNPQVRRGATRELDLRGRAAVGEISEWICGDVGERWKRKLG